MEETKQLKNRLGIASFVIGIIGFLTGFIAIGIIFDIIAIILGIIALISKKNKKDFAIAGVIISTLGLLIMIFLFNIFDTSNEVKITDPNNVQISENTDDGNDETDIPSETSKSKATLGSVIELKNFSVVFNSYEIVKIDNQFADVEEAIVISTSITNTSDETESMMTGITKTCFTPTGTEAGDDSQIYLNDEYPSYWHDHLRANATLETYMVCDYSGDGEYIIEIGMMFGDPVEVFIDIKK